MAGRWWDKRYVRGDDVLPTYPQLLCLLRLLNWISANTQCPVVQSFSQLICGPIFGALLGTGSEQDRLHNFARAICLGAAMMVVATGFMIMARWKSAGWTLRVKT